MIPHEPFLAFTRKNDKRKKNDNVGYVNDLCPDSWNPKFFLNCSIILRLFSAFGLFLSLFVCRNGANSAQGRCLVGGHYTPFLMIAAISRKKRNIGFTNDNKTTTKTITFGIKNGPCKTLPFFSPFSYPFPFLFPVSSFTLPFPSPFLFPVLFSFPFSCPFSFPFPFLFLSFFFPFPFAFFFPFPFLFLSLSFSFPFPFPLPFLFFPFPSFTITIPFPFPFPRLCEFFDQGVKPALGKTIRGKKR